MSDQEEQEVVLDVGAAIANFRCLDFEPVHEFSRKNDVDHEISGDKAAVGDEEGHRKDSLYSTKQAKSKRKATLRKLFSDLSRAVVPYGIENQHLEALFDLVEDYSDKGEDAIAAKLIKIGAVPCSTVSVDIIIRMLGSIWTVGSSVKQHLLNFIVLVFDVIDKIQPLHALYELFFQLLQQPQLRLQAAQILYRLTRKSDVTLFRIRSLHKLLSSYGELDGNREPNREDEQYKQQIAPVWALLVLYHEFAPSLIVQSGLATRLSTVPTSMTNSVMRCPDSGWYRKIQTAQNLFRRKNRSQSFDDTSDSEREDLPFALPHQKKIGAKWNKAGPTTPTHTSVNGGHAKLSSSDDVYEPPRKRRKREEPNPLATFSSEYAHSVGTSTSRAAVTRIPSTFTHSDNLAIKSYDSKGEYPTSPSDTSSSTSTAYFPDQPSRSLPEICNFDEFVEHLDKIELPNRIASVFQNKFLAHLLMLEPNEESILRINTWLSFAMEDTFSWRDVSQMTSEDQEALLSLMLNFAQRTHELPNAMNQFFREFLRTWDGDTHFNLVMGLLEYLEPQPYALLYMDILRPIAKIASHLTSYKKTRIIVAYTKLLKRWLVFDWSAHWKAVETFHKNGKSTNTYDNGLTFSHGPHPTDSIDYFETIAEFIRHVDAFASAALQTEDGEYPPLSDLQLEAGRTSLLWKSPGWYNLHDDVVLQFAILDFYDIVSQLYGKYKLPLAILPSSTIVYRCLLSSNSMAVSRIADIISRYKYEIEGIKQITFTKHVPPTAKAALTVIQQLNSYIWTLGNVMWKSKLLSPADTRSSSPSLNGLSFMFVSQGLGLHLFRLTRTICTRSQVEHFSPESAQQCLSIARSNALITYAYQFLQEMGANAHQEQGHNPNNSTDQPLSLEVFKDNQVKRQYVDYLRSQGLLGLYNFLTSTITSLAKHRAEMEKNRKQNSKHGM